MRTRAALALLLLASVTTSCLTYESLDVRFDRIAPDDPAAAHGAWRYDVRVRHLESDASKPADREADFAKLLEDYGGWRDSVRLGRSGFFRAGVASECTLLVERGVLVMHERGVTPSLDSLAGGDLRIDRGDSLVVGLTRSELGPTNGRIRAAGDSVYVVWPRTASTVSFSSLNRPFAPHRASRFVERWRKWIATR